MNTNNKLIEANGKQPICSGTVTDFGDGSFTITDAQEMERKPRNREGARDSAGKAGTVRRLAMLGCSIAIIATGVTEAAAQFRYGPAPTRGFGYPTGPSTPRGLMQPIRPSGGWGPTIRSTPMPVYRGLGQGLRGVPTTLFYPQRVY